MWIWNLWIYVHMHLLFSFTWDMNTWCIYIAWRVLVNRVWRASAQICDMVPSGTLWFLREHFGPFGDNMVPSGTFWPRYGVNLCSTQREFEMYLGLETSILLMICYMISEWLSMRFTVLSGNTIYIGIPIIWLFILYHVHSAFACVTYWVLYSQIFLYCRGY